MEDFLSSLPPYLSAHIFILLGEEFAVRRLYFVSKAWCKIAQSDLVWLPFVMQRWSSDYKPNCDSGGDSEDIRNASSNMNKGSTKNSTSNNIAVNNKWRNEYISKVQQYCNQELPFVVYRSPSRALALTNYVYLLSSELEKLLFPVFPTEVKQYPY